MFSSNDQNEVRSDRLKPSTVRIPIFIRIGEFASWLKENSSKKLIDYIGEHTWFANEYCPTNTSRDMFKQLIDHGHALILLDGLDEIAEVKSREVIVDMVKDFIHTYVKDPNSISAFDDTLFDRISPVFHIAESQPPKKPGGNQIIITSRVVGYELNALTGSFIKHYLLLGINEEVLNEFVTNWMDDVQEFVNKVLLNVGIPIDQNKLAILTNKRIQAAKSIFEKKKKMFLNCSLLSLICSNIFQSSEEFHLKSEIEIFNDVVQSAFHFWIQKEATISRELLEQFLLNLSTYLQFKSSSGLIDTFNIKQLACSTVQQRNITKISAQIRDIIYICIFVECCYYRLRSLKLES